MTRITQILFLILVVQIGYSQTLQIDSLSNLILDKYYTSLDDHYSLLSRDYQHNYFGHHEIIEYVNKDEIFRNIKSAFEESNQCTRLELINQTHLNYCKGIEKLELLEYLNLSYVQTEKWGNYIREIPHGVYDLQRLKILIADNTNLKLLSHDIATLAQLEYLSLSQGKLTELPKEIGDLKNLVVLDLSYNQINLLPDNIKNLKNLKYLNLAGNPLEYSIHEELEGLINLEFVSIEFSDKASNIEQTIEALTKLPKLKVLHLRYSNLTTLPASFKNFKHLEQLSLRGNYQLDLAAAFSLLSKIQSLHTLDLSFSRIDKLPDGFGEMQNLENIYLGNWKWCCPIIDFFGETPYNRIHELPKSVSKMKKLKNLYLWTWEVTDKEKEKMKTLIPNVNIEFDSKRPEIDLELIEEEK